MMETLKHNRSMEEAPHNCQECAFQCVTKEQVQKLQTSYKQHVNYQKGVVGSNPQGQVLCQQPWAIPR